MLRMFAAYPLLLAMFVHEHLKTWSNTVVQLLALLAMLEQTAEHHNAMVAMRRAVFDM